MARKDPASFASPAFHILSSARSILRENGLDLSLTISSNKEQPGFLAVYSSNPVYTQLRKRMGHRAPPTKIESVSSQVIVMWYPCF